MRHLTVGILAHVDAGKTTLTERLLFAAGAITSMGSVDEGTTHADTEETERRRGITIRSSVLKLMSDDVSISVVDTPGHTDFIAEVERALVILDAAILVVPGNEDLQPHARRLIRVLRDLELPVLVFINKIDLAVPDQIAQLEQSMRSAFDQRIVAATTPVSEHMNNLNVMAVANDVLLERLALADDTILETVISGGLLDSPRAILIAQCRQARLAPILHGSARSGLGVNALLAVLKALAPPDSSASGRPVRAEVFKIESAGPEHRAIAKVSSGRLADGMAVYRHRGGLAKRHRVRDVRRFMPAAQLTDGPVDTGDIAVLSAAELRVGDLLTSEADPDRVDVSRVQANVLAPPPFETVVHPEDPQDRERLFAALTGLAQMDPLMRVRTEPGSIVVSLHGDVQRQVLAEHLERSAGVHATFTPLQVRYAERPTRVGKSSVTFGEGHPFAAEIELTVSPASPPSTATPIFAVHNRCHIVPRAFREAVREAVVHAWEWGHYGWQLVGATVTLTGADYSSSHSSGGDFRRLAPMVLARAVRRSEPEVLEPVALVLVTSAEVDTGSIVTIVSSHRGRVADVAVSGDDVEIEAQIPSSLLMDVTKEITRSTSGRAMVNLRGRGFQRAARPWPRGARKDGHPANTEAYLAWLHRQ